jgi:hypothetical protein
VCAATAPLPDAAWFGEAISTVEKFSNREWTRMDANESRLSHLLQTLGGHPVMPTVGRNRRIDSRSFASIRGLDPFPERSAGMPGRMPCECNRDDQPALPGASGSTIGVHEMSTPGSRDSREKAQEAQKEPDQCDLMKWTDS